MTIKVLIAAGALLASTSVMAQAGPVQDRSAKELICQLSGDCAGFDELEATLEKPEDRGFKVAKIARRGEAPGPTPAVRPRRTASVNPAVAAAPARAVTASSPGRNRPAASGPAKAAAGRANLKVSFVTGSAALTEAGKRQALTFVAALASPSLSGKRFRIEGHTDAVGSRESNLDLSKRRAAAVVDFLAANGADRSQFEIQGYGFDKPVSANPAENRRVEVVLVK